MDIGMLWFDNDKGADLNIKVTRAAQYYKKKYGQTPNLCFVNPCMVAANGNGNGSHSGKKIAKTGNGVEIRESTTLLPNHFWIGVYQPEV
jgi:hypothetical protein